jgi:hypothetical protein
MLAMLAYFHENSIEVDEYFLQICDRSFHSTQRAMAGARRPLQKGPL